MSFIKFFYNVVPISDKIVYNHKASMCELSMTLLVSLSPTCQWQFPMLAFRLADSWQFNLQTSRSNERDEETRLELVSLVIELEVKIFIKTLMIFIEIINFYLNFE